MKAPFLLPHEVIHALAGAGDLQVVKLAKRFSNRIVFNERFVC